MYRIVATPWRGAVRNAWVEQVYKVSATLTTRWEKNRIHSRDHFEKNLMSNLDVHASLGAACSFGTENQHLVFLLQ